MDNFIYSIFALYVALKPGQFGLGINVVSTFIMRGLPAVDIFFAHLNITSVLCHINSYNIYILCFFPLHYLCYIPCTQIICILFILQQLAYFVLDLRKFYGVISTEEILWSKFYPTDEILWSDFRSIKDILRSNFHSKS